MAFPQNTFTWLLFICVSFQGREVWAKVDLSIEKSVEAYLGDSAQILCQFNFSGKSWPSFVMIQWHVMTKEKSWKRIFYTDYNQQMVDEDTEYSGRIQVTTHQQETTLTVEDVRLSDERVFICQVSGLTAGMGEAKTRIRVFAPPEPPVIEAALTAISVTNERLSKVASCEVQNSYPKPNITWYRNDVLLVPEDGHANVVTLVTRESGGLYVVQSELQYKVVREDQDALFTCEVSFFVPGAARTAASRSVNVTVHYPASMVELFKDSPKGLVKEGDTVELRCQGDGKPPSDSFIFYREQEPDVELGGSGDMVVLSRVTRGDSGLYQCRPLDNESVATGEMQLTVHYLDPVAVVPRDSEVMFMGENLTATCNALSSLGTSTVWYKDGMQVGKGHILTLHNATYKTSGEYTCLVTVPSLPALRTNGSVFIIVQGAPQLNGDDREVELEGKEGSLVNLSCKSQGNPLPSISWNIVGNQSWREVVNRVSENTVHSVISVEVTSNTTAVCNASNNMGTAFKAFNITTVPKVTPHSPFSEEASGVVMVGIILCILLIAIMGSVLYFLCKKGKVPCRRSGKHQITKEDIFLEMAVDMQTEKAILNGLQEQYIDIKQANQ